MFAYESYIRIIKFHNDIITIASPEQTLGVLTMLPLAFIISWFFNVSMAVWIWICCNFLLFLPKMIKSSPKAIARADKVYLNTRKIARKIPKLRDFVVHGDRIKKEL